MKPQSERRATQEKRQRAYLPPLHAKEVEVDGSRRSPGFASKDGFTIRSRPRPSRFPSGRGQFPRLQLRGSAGFAPASQSSPSGEDARSERHFKEPEETRE